MGLADEVLTAQVSKYASRDSGFGASGVLSSSITHIEEVSETGVIGMVFSPQNYVEAVEIGTRPHWPPIEPLVDWVKVKFGLPEKDARSMAHAVAWKISRVGTEGKFMFRRGLEKQQAEVQRIFEAAVARIAARLGGRAP